MNRPLWIIETNHGPSGYSVENFDNRQSVTREIAEGYHFSKTFTVARVLEITSDLTCKDITKDVAREVRDIVLRDCPNDYGWHMADWLHRHLGVNSVQWPIEEAQFQP
jgi:hypothetical protein